MIPKSAVPRAVLGPSANEALEPGSQAAGTTRGEDSDSEMQLASRHKKALESDSVGLLAKAKPPREEKKPVDVVDSKDPDNLGETIKIEENGIPKKVFLKPGRVARTARVAAPRKEPKAIELALVLDTEQKKQASDQEQSPHVGGPVGTIAGGAVQREGNAGFKTEVFYDALSDVRDLIYSVDGKVISVEYSIEPRHPQSVWAKIPAKHYNAFFEKLKRLGNLESIPPKLPSVEEDTIPVHISFESKSALTQTTP
jgi:hypothetical protein